MESDCLYAKHVESISFLKSERMREWCKPECRPKLYHQKYDVKIKSDPVLEELVRTRKRMRPPVC